MVGVVNTATFAAKEGLDEVIAHLEDSREVDVEQVLVILHTTCDRMQCASLANVVIEMAGWGGIEVAACTLHAGIRNLCVETAKAIFGQNDIGQLERLLAEVTVSHQCLFGCQLSTVMVIQVKRAKDWNRFVKLSEVAGLKKLLTVASQATSSSSLSQPFQSRGTRRGSRWIGVKKGELWGGFFTSQSEGRSDSPRQQSAGQGRARCGDRGACRGRHAASSSGRNSTQSKEKGHKS